MASHAACASPSRPSCSIAVTAGPQVSAGNTATTTAPKTASARASWVRRDQSASSVTAEAISRPGMVTGRKRRMAQIWSGVMFTTHR